MNRLREIWNEVSRRYTGNRELIDKCWTEIEKEYSAQSRHYHNLGHIEYMVEKAENYKNSLKDADTVLFAIFYHDIFYKAGHQNNEQKSAEKARDRLSRFELAPGMIERCQEQILATKEHKDNADPDTNYLIDFDLAILGESPEVYKEYAKKIRKEFSIYPDFLYHKGRKKVLQHFLNMERIFKTDDFHARYEQEARKNLEAELMG